MRRRRGPIELFLTLVGDIKVFRWPFFMVYDPAGYQVRGSDVRVAMEILQPGDILVRSYTNYLDGYFIPGYFSHAGLYLGEITEADRDLIPKELPEDIELVKGKQVVIHAIAEGVQMEDFLQFCRCDGMAILRFPSRLQRTCEVSDEMASKLQIVDKEERAIFEDLRAGKTVEFQRAFAAIRRSALSLLGRDYDFQFDFVDFSHVSCTELVFYATRCVSPFLGMFPKKHRVLLMNRIGIIPDAVVSSPLDLIWQSPSCEADQLEALRSAVPTPVPALPVADKATRAA